MNRQTAISLVLATLATGCATGHDAFGRMLEGQETMIAEVAKVAAVEPVKAGEDAPLKLPSMEARFCLDRALDNVKKARQNTGWDTALIIMGASNLTTGAVTQAAAAALPNKPDGTAASGRSALQVIGVATMAGAAGILALRTTLSLSDVARAERIAAAKNVDAAISIFQHYAVTDDPKEVGKDAFATCRDGDIDIAASFQGGKAGDALQKLLDGNTQATEDKKAAGDASAAAAEGAQKQEGVAAKAQEDALSRSKAVMRAIGPDLAKKVQPKVDAANAAHDRAIDTLKKYGEARAAMKAAPPSTSGAARAVAKDQADAAVKAVSEAGAKTKDAAASAAAVANAGTADALSKQGAAAAETANMAAAEIEKLRDADTQADAAKADAAKKVARAEVAQKRVELFQAMARWRRALFFLTAADRRLAGEDVLKLTDELEAWREALRKLERPLQPEGGPSVKR